MDARIKLCQIRSDFVVPVICFITFEQAEAVEKALKDKPIKIYGTHRLKVERMKHTHPRPPFRQNNREEEYRRYSSSQNYLPRYVHVDRGREVTGSNRKMRGKSQWAPQSGEHVILEYLDQNIL